MIRVLNMEGDRDGIRFGMLMIGPERHLYFYDRIAGNVRLVQYYTGFPSNFWDPTEVCLKGDELSAAVAQLEARIVGAPA